MSVSTTSLSEEANDQQEVWWVRVRGVRPSPEGTCQCEGPVQPRLEVSVFAALEQTEAGVFPFLGLLLQRATDSGLNHRSFWSHSFEVGCPR